MTPLADRWNEIAARAAAAPALGVGTDFDGTLVPFHDRPEAVELPDRVRAVLRDLAAAPGVTLALVSGRALADLERRADLERAILIGNHGFETRLPDGVRRLAVEGADLAAPRAAGRALAAATATVPGVWLEDKGPTLALHFRQAPPDRVSQLLAAARRAAEPFAGKVRLTQGHSVLEVRPAVRDVDKGRALRRAFADAGVPASALLFYFGDDATDEDAFAALPADAVTVHVGAPADASAAHYLVSGPEEVFAALARLAALRRRAGGRPDHG